MSIQVTEKDSRSWPAYITSLILSNLSSEFIVDLPKLGNGFKDVVGSPELPPPPFGMQGCPIVHRVVDNLHVYDVLPGPKNNPGTNGPKTKIYFLAGGAFLAPAGIFQWSTCAEIVMKIPNTTASMVSYPLTPLNSAPTAYAAIQKTMQTLLAESAEKGERVIYIGDSAGSNLVTSLPLASLKENPKALLPKAIIAISPAVDFFMNDPASKATEPNDAVLSVAFCKKACKDWAGTWSYDDPRVSPTFGDLSQFVKHGVKVHGIVGTHDVLAPDGLTYMKKLNTAGVSGKWLVWKQQGHDFSLANVLGVPEAVVATKWMLQTIVES